jgi:hypothetical protein|tara:strand:- start:63 stop:302 length:240 start_codon:yes stop_codon:yes gene_type:complete
MSLWIEVYVGGRNNKTLVASSVAHNVSDLADTSDYTYTNVEPGCESLGIPYSEDKGTITEHNRRSSVWKLVEKIAKGTG